MTTKGVLTVVVALVAFLVASSSAGSKPAGFSARVDNPWYPLKPGSVYVYRGVKDGEPAREVMTVTHRTKVIDGAPCVVVSDLLYLSGRLEERTIDWYTQDAKGNVWYFGEKTAELDKNGKVKSTAGSWTAGVDGARPGIFMFARPNPVAGPGRSTTRARPRITSRSSACAPLCASRTSRRAGRC